MSDRPMKMTLASSPDAPALNDRAPVGGVEPTRRGITGPIVLTCAAVLFLYIRSLAAPVVFYDDFQILTQSRTWERTRDGLWVPQNEHAMPLGRLFCFALECLAGRLPVLPFVICWVGPLSLLAGLFLVYLFA